MTLPEGAQDTSPMTLVQRLRWVHGLGQRARTQDEYTAAGEKAIRIMPEVCAHLLSQDAEIERLARENAELHKSALGGYEDGWHALRNERDSLKAELAKLKARIAEAPVVTVRRQIDGDGDTGKLPSRDDLPANYIGKQVALVKLEDEAEREAEES